jgi:hypothetical protein
MCPEEASLRAAVATRLGYDPFFPWARTTVIVELTRRPPGFHGRVQMVDEHGLALGERVLDTASDDCGKAIAALALAISIALDDLDAMATPDSAPVDVRPEPRVAPAPPPPAPAPGPLPPTPPVPPPRQAGAGSLVVSVGAQGSLGLAPAPSVGAYVACGVRRGRWSGGVEIEANAPASAVGDGGARVEAHRTSTTATGCMHLGLPFLCATATLGAFEAHGEVAMPRGRVARYAGVGARVGLDVPLLSGRYFLRIFGGGEVSLSPIQVSVDGFAAYTLPMFSGALGLGAGVRLF